MKLAINRHDDDAKIFAARSNVDPNQLPPIDPPPPSPPPPSHDEDPVAKARYEADTARAESERLKKRLDELSKQVLTDEQRARYAELEAKAREDEEKRLAERGEFDKWRSQIQDKHTRELESVRAETTAEAARREATEKELKDTLIGLAFSGATDLFGPSGKTTMLPDVAKAYFSGNVSVEMAKPQHGGGPEVRRVVVRDANGTVIVDPKTGHPMEFQAAMTELVMSHPQRIHMLRGSGKVGSGSAGGSNAGQETDLSKLKPQDFKDPAVRERVRRQYANKGGMQIGPAFDTLNDLKNKG